MPICAVIHERRRALGLTQEQMADYLGVSTPAVNKWEKGITYPDITLVPSLARLLRVDLNTLLCFQETLTEQEIVLVQEEICKETEKNGIDAGFALAEKKIQEYPTCGRLIESMAVIMQGSLILADIPENDKEIYQSQITVWYERAIECDNETVRNRVGYILVSQYLKSGNYEKAQQVLDRLPESNILSKDVFQSDIFFKQGRPEEAAKILQRCLLWQGNHILSIFSRLVDIELENGKEEIAREIATKAKTLADVFDMWGHLGLVGFQSIASKTKNVPESLSILEQILASTEKPWTVNQSPLYHYLYPEAVSGISVTEKILPPLLKAMETDPQYDFLRSNKEFQKLFERYHKR